MDFAKSSENSGLATSGWVSRLVLVSVLLFLPTVASVKDAGSILWLILLLLGFWYGRGWSSLERDEKQVLLGFAVLLGIMGLTLINTEDFAVAGERLDRFARIALLPPIYLMLRRLGIRAGNVFVLGAAITGLVLAIQGWYRVEYLGAGRAAGHYYAILFGDIAMLAAVLSLVGMGFLTHSAKQKLLFGIAAAFAGYASVLSGSRGAWVALPPIILVLLWLYRGRINKRTWLATGGAFLLLIVAAMNISTVHNGFARGVSEIDTFVNDPAKQSSWGIRLNLWRNSVLLAEESPLLGTGIGDFRAEMRRMVEDGISWSPAVQRFDHAHSIYFDALATSGILGLIALVVALFYLPFRYFYRYWSPDADRTVQFYSLGGMLSLVAFAVFGASEGWLTRHPFVVSYIMCVAVFMSGLANTIRSQRSGSE